MPVEELGIDDPQQVGPYRVLARLGQGGMGVVYLVIAGGVLRALKLVRRDLVSDGEFRNRFEREVTAARAITGPYVARFVDALLDGPAPYLVSEYVEGPTLDEEVRREGALGEERSLSIATGLARALATIHEAGVVHRDLKPSNVILGASGPRVIDFGISVALDATRITDGALGLGSPAWMSPEAAKGKAVTAPADVFGWGAVVAYSATGRLPFGRGPAAAVLYRVVNEEPDLAGVPPELLPIVERALSKDPADRPSALQLGAALAGEPLPPLTYRPDLPTAPEEMVTPPHGVATQTPPGRDLPDSASGAGRRGRSPRPSPSRRRPGVRALIAAILAVALLAGGAAVVAGESGSTHKASAGHHATGPGGPELVQRGQEGTAVNIPWSQVADGWSVALWYPSTDATGGGSGTPTLYLVDPLGGRYKIASDAAFGGATLTAWSGSKDHVLLATSSSPTSSTVSEVELSDGRAVAQFQLGGFASAQFTLPEGKALVLGQTGAGVSQPVLRRTSDAGATEQAFPNGFTGVGASDGTAIYTPDGAVLVIGAATGLALVWNSGAFIRSLPVAGTECLPLKWWAPNTLLARCGAQGASTQLWLVPTEGGAPSEVAGGTDVADLWRIGSKTYGVLSGQSTSIVSLSTAGDQPVSAPGIASAVIVGSYGSELELDATGDVCHGAGAAGQCLLFFDPASGRSTVVLGGSLDGGTVSTVIAFSDPTTT
ncbi:MAG TPA: serine/threonine-protein kinase [Acidimicrobiales bacterium]|nr:serine/threonine-protein kinase [Acidimicrobiales bacterium]